VISFLHRLFAALFYLLGASFFVTFALVRAKLGDIWPAWWLQVADLPLAASAMGFAGLSLYQSLKSDTTHAIRLAWMIGVPLVVLFVVLVVFNFWPLLT
jgi:hypothetical protein